MLIPDLPTISIFNTSPANPQIASAAEDAVVLALLVSLTVALSTKSCRSTACFCILLIKPANDSN
jgi:hypothetical protein